MEFTELKDDVYIGEKFNEYKKTPEYKEYTELIQNDKPLLSPYLIEIAIFGFFYENLRETMEPEQLKKYPSLIELVEAKEYTKPEVQSEYKGISVYESEADYIEKNPHIKPIPIVNPFENLEKENEILN